MLAVNNEPDMLWNSCISSLGETSHQVFFVVDLKLGAAVIPLSVPERFMPIMPYPSRILIIRPSALGDVCRSVPVLTRLRRVYPQARIDWMVQRGFEDVVKAHPDLSSVVLFDRIGLGTSLRHGNFRPLLAFARVLRDKHYDMVLDCQGLFRSGLFAWLTRSPLRIGPANARELGWVFYTKRVQPYHDTSSIPRHTVASMLDIASAAGAVRPTNLPADSFVSTAELQLYAPPDDIATIKADTQLNRPYILIAPGSRWLGKQWPKDRFASLITHLLKHSPTHSIVLTGSSAERQLCETIAAATGQPSNRILNMAGQTTIGQLMALVKSSDLIVANDSATVHLAVGFDRPLVALYGPTNVAQVGPCNRQRDVISHRKPSEKASHKHTRAGQQLMARISVDEVFQACRQRLERRHNDTIESIVHEHPIA